MGIDAVRHTSIFNTRAPDSSEFSLDQRLADIDLLGEQILSASPKDRADLIEVLGNLTADEGEIGGKAREVFGRLFASPRLPAASAARIREEFQEAAHGLFQRAREHQWLKLPVQMAGFAARYQGKGSGPALRSEIGRFVQRQLQMRGAPLSETAASQLFSGARRIDSTDLRAAAMSLPCLSKQVYVEPTAEQVGQIVERLKTQPGPAIHALWRNAGSSQAPDWKLDLLVKGRGGELSCFRVLVSNQPRAQLEADLQRDLSDAGLGEQRPTATVFPMATPDPNRTAVVGHTLLKSLEEEMSERPDGPVANGVPHEVQAFLAAVVGRITKAEPDVQDAHTLVTEAEFLNARATHRVDPPRAEVQEDPPVDRVTALRNGVVAEPDAARRSRAIVELVDAASRGEKDAQAALEAALGFAGKSPEGMAPIRIELLAQCLRQYEAAEGLASDASPMVTYLAAMYCDQSRDLRAKAQPMEADLRARVAESGVPFEEGDRLLETARYATDMELSAAAQRRHFLRPSEGHDSITIHGNGELAEVLNGLREEVRRAGAGACRLLWLQSGMQYQHWMPLIVVNENEHDKEKGDDIRAYVLNTDGDSGKPSVQHLEKILGTQLAATFPAGHRLISHPMQQNAPGACGVLSDMLLDEIEAQLEDPETPLGQRAAGAMPDALESLAAKWNSSHAIHQQCQLVAHRSALFEACATARYGNPMDAHMAG